MWNNISLHIQENDHIIYNKVCEITNNHKLKYMDFPVQSIGHIFIIHANSPTDRSLFQGIFGVTILEHPHHPKLLSKDTHMALIGHLVHSDTAHDMWLKIHAIHPHPALHPDT